MNKTFRVLKKIILYTFSILLFLSIAGYVYLYVLPKGPKITATQKINNGIDSFVIHAHKESERKSIKVWTYKPENWRKMISKLINTARVRFLVLSWKC